MEVHVIFPKTKEGIGALMDRVDEAHAQIIIKYIKNLECSDNVRTDLIEYLRKKSLEMSKIGRV